MVKWKVLLAARTKLLLFISMGCHQNETVKTQFLPQNVSHDVRINQSAFIASMPRFCMHLMTHSLAQLTTY